MMIHKLGLVGTQKNCSVLIISPLVALMMNQAAIRANHFGPQLRVSLFLLAPNLCTKDNLDGLIDHLMSSTHVGL